MRFELRETADGSLTVFDAEAGETYKSRHAARTEAEHVFYGPAVLQHPHYGERPLDVVELGFGLGTNFQHFLGRGFRGNFRSIERDLAGAEFFLQRCPDPDLSELVERGELTRGELHASLHRGDFFEVLPTLPPADAILFDPFSPKANPEAWTRELFSQCFRLLRPGGRLVSYSVSRVAKDVATEAGFEVSKLKLPDVLNKRSSLLAIRPGRG